MSFVHWLCANLLNMTSTAHIEQTNSENLGATPVHNHVQRNWITMPYVHVGIHPTNATVPHAKAIVNSNIALVAPVSQFGICNQFSVSVSAQGAGDSAQT